MSERFCYCYEREQAALPSLMSDWRSAGLNIGHPEFGTVSVLLEDGETLVEPDEFARRLSLGLDVTFQLWIAPQVDVVCGIARRPEGTEYVYWLDGTLPDQEWREFTEGGASPSLPDVILAKDSLALCLNAAERAASPAAKGYQLFRR